MTNINFGDKPSRSFGDKDFMKVRNVLMPARCFACCDLYL
jgi:hypothetical protein